MDQLNEIENDLDHARAVIRGDWPGSDEIISRSRRSRDIIGSTKQGVKMHESTMAIFDRMLVANILEVTILDQKAKIQITKNNLHIPTNQLAEQNWFPNATSTKVFSIDDGEWIDLDPMTVTHFTVTQGE